MKKRILSVLTALALVLTWLPSAAIAAESGAAPDSMGIERGYREEHVSVPDAEDLPSNDELFAGYVDMLFYGDIFDEDMGLFSTGSETAGSKLTGNLLTAYNSLVSEIQKILNGTSESTVFTVSVGGIDKAGLNTLIKALLVDHPYELFWYDKTAGVSTSSDSTQTTFSMYVSANYAKENQIKTTTVDKAKVSAAVAAKTNADAIVAEAANKSSAYEKLKFFNDKICELVDYNYDALESDPPYGDPWQMIYVFDKDPSTKVVCEGYSKAFQYLCDRAFSNGAVQCYTVTGYMAATGNASGQGPHMWNVVTIDNANYLVDVTNCDEKGTDGATTGPVLLCPVFGRFHRRGYRSYLWR